MNYLFADTANLKEIIEANDMGVIQGVTTNPSIIAKEPSGSFNDLIGSLAEYCGAEDLSLSVEVFAEGYDPMVKQACEIYDKFVGTCPNLYVKIPVSVDGLKAIKTCSKQGVKINATICYSEQQLVHCASAGAKYVSLFYCRLKQHGGDVERSLRRTKQYINENGLDTQIIAGSIRTQQDVADAWDYGADIVTTGLSVIKEMVFHPKTTESYDGFMSDFASWMK
jgi:transaldolase|tara:strand:- start:5225 stop:5896 length:672 start_codon:yes stop_codon:yes gene_type:complete